MVALSDYFFLKINSLSVLGLKYFITRISYTVLKHYTKVYNINYSV